MSSRQVSNDTATEASAAAAVPLRLEVVVVPVADADRAKAFYGGLGWRLDADVGAGDYRVTSDQPGSIESLLVAVDDLDAARDELISRGAEVSEVFHDDAGGLGGGFHPGTEGRATGPDPEGRSYGSYALVHRSRRQPLAVAGDHRAASGAGVMMDVAAVAELLKETAEHHDSYEQVAPAHDWWDWYAAYFDARQSGSTSDEASAAAGRYMAEVKHVVVPSA